MRLLINQLALLKLTQSVSGLVERRHTLPILSHLLMRATDDGLELLSTDNEMVLSCRSADVQVEQMGSVTVPARKLLDIAKVLPAHAMIQISISDHKLLIVSGSSRFTLLTLPVHDFPIFQLSPQFLSISLPFAQLLAHLSATVFAMGEKDVRLYLNGLLLCIEGNALTTVASDGHRLAVMSSEVNLGQSPGQHVGQQPIQLVLLKKMVTELLRLNWVLGQVQVSIGKSDIQISNTDFCFSSRLLDVQYPDYRRVLPAGDCVSLQVNRVLFREALQRASILSPDNHRVIFCHLSPGLLRLQASNADKESALDEIAVDYSGNALEVVYNVDYLLDAIQILSSEWVHVEIYQPNLAAIITDSENAKARYLVMPMLL
jgi:DNA polymerase-3 subunit beta